MDNAVMEGITLCEAYPWRCVPLHQRLLLSNIPIFVGILLISIILLFVLTRFKKNNLYATKKTRQFFLIVIAIAGLISIFTLLSVLVTTRFKLNLPAVECVLTHNRGDCIEQAAYKALPPPDAKGNVDYQKALNICNLYKNVINSPEICKERVCDNLYISGSWSDYPKDVYEQKKEECRMLVRGGNYHCSDYQHNYDEEWIDCGGKDCSECTPEHRENINDGAATEENATKEVILIYLDERRDSKGFRRLYPSNAQKVADEIVSEEMREYYLATPEGANNYIYRILPALTQSDQTPIYILEKIIDTYTKDNSIPINSVADVFREEYPQIGTYAEVRLQYNVKWAKENIEKRK